MPLETDTVAIPITKGINLQTDARLVQPPDLLEATNTRFTTGGGATKRRGHDAVEIRSEAAIPTNAVSADYLEGWGLTTTQTTAHHSGNYIRPGGLLAGDGIACMTSDWPYAGRLLGTGQRDQETVVWTGDRLLSYAPSQETFAEVTPAVLPSLNSYPTAKTAGAQLFPTVADNGRITLVAWRDAGTGVRYSMYDSVSRAPIAVNQTLAGLIAPAQIRAFSLGRFVHLFVSDSSLGKLFLYAWPDSAPSAAPTVYSYGDCNVWFDHAKVSDTLAAVVVNNSGSARVLFVGEGGNTDPHFGTWDYSPGHTATADMQVAIAWHPFTYTIALAWLKSNFLEVAFFDPTGVTGGAYTVSHSDVPTKISLAPKYLLSGAEDPSTHALGSLFDLYWSQDTGSTTLSRLRFSSIYGNNGSAVTKKCGLYLLSQAFRAGDRTYAWAAHRSTLQSCFFLVDENLDPVGKAEWGIANADVTYHLCGVNWCGADNPDTSFPAYTAGGFTPTSSAALSPLKFHGAFSYKLRVTATSVNTGVFTEPCIRHYDLNMRPTLRQAQAGRCLYFAGAQLWSYDGENLYEANFHLGPEMASTPSPSSGGSLSFPGTYSYRIDLCHRNAQNEEIRSLSILTDSISTTSPNKTIVLTIPTILTRRPDAYFLVFRNAMAAGVPLDSWWLLNSRDPADASFLLNDQTLNHVTFTDSGTTSDADIQTHELHPANILNTYLQPVSAPACEIVSAGRDRLWVAGGELPPGQVAPSRLFDPGEVPSFNPYLNFQVDRSAEAITAVGFVGEIAAFFRKHSTYVMDGDGPDNSSVGTWSPARLALADLGALGQESLALLTSGLVFQSPAGFRLLGPSGSLTPIGLPVDIIAATFPVSSTVVLDSDQEVRWYGTSGTLVYNYLYDVWAQWTVTATGAARDLVSGKALVAQSSGRLFTETDTSWQDGDRPYTQRIRLPWLHGGNLGDFQRVRSISGIGHPTSTDSPNHNIHLDLYYDDQEFAAEWFDWTYPDASNNTDTWGAANFGDGVFGDTASTDTSLRDSSWEWKRSPRRQKCSVFSVAIDDRGTTGPGFTIIAFGLRLRKKPGLNRTPTRGGTSNFRE